MGSAFLPNNGVTPFGSALWRWSRRTAFAPSESPTANPGSPSFLTSPSRGEGTMVPVPTVARAIAEHRLDRVDFIKMDVEGGVGTEHTRAILANNERAIETIRAIDNRHQDDVTETHSVKNPSRGWILTPYSLCFSVRSD